ncbi:HipA family kinase [Methylocucumis oryzae]|uniref:HipA-like kinase domain-containing protein n=1 Tax=Methylocucumis oryzae TaxID=1632867 RepID=A0A0F3IMP4_9GAMM|nr:HipA family kinase [Methylocucumis oryzae]KJV08010.1 hypothetical protein VZ94_00915 [Methylocucumis oryzae]
MIRIGRIVNTIKPAENGKYGAQIVKVALNDYRYELTAYAKKLNELEFWVEVMASLLGIELGLPIPEPIAAVDENNDVWFASVDMKYPDLTRRLSTANPQAYTQLIHKIANWSEIQKAIQFDEWIANDDRNAGNILYDGGNQFYLIDHNRAMRLPFAPDAPIRNVLLNIRLATIKKEDDLGRQRLKQQLHMTLQSFDSELPTAIAKRIIDVNNKTESQLLADIVEFLRKRVHYLLPITQQKISTSQQSLL